MYASLLYKVREEGGDPDSPAGMQAVAALIVGGIRAHLTNTSMYCSVCLTFSEEHIPHPAGSKCIETMETSNKVGDAKWQEFTSSFVLPGETTCPSCLLPTVNFFLDVRIELRLNVRQESSAPGSAFHTHGDCDDLDHLIKPVLYILQAGDYEREKTFIRWNMRLGDESPWANIKKYSRWLAEKSPGYETFNYLLLFWWLVVYRGGPEQVWGRVRYY